MKRQLLITIIVIVVVLLAILGYFIRYPFLYESRYFEKIGIKGAWLYKDIIADKGMPINEEMSEGYTYVHYDGLTLVFGENKERGVMRGAIITGQQYRFGIWHIGVGSTRKEVESVYRNVRKIKDLPVENFGVIEGNTWVWFEFDENDVVSKIRLTDGL